MVASSNWYPFKRPSLVSFKRPLTPEHAPEQFRRIREAFEQVKAKLERGSHYAETIRQGIHETVVESISDSAVSSQEARERGPPVPMSSEGNLRRENEMLWQLACRGDDHLAYKSLLGRREISRAADIYSQLYWLLLVNPELDANRHRCDWIVEGLHANNAADSLRELYRRELMANPLESISERCASLMESLTPVESMSDLLEWRWRALASLEQWAIIYSDIELVRPLVALDRQEIWADLLILAIELLAFSHTERETAAIEAYRDEIDQLRHLHASFGHDYERIDLLFEIREAWHDLLKADDVPAAWIELLPAALNPSLDACRQNLMMFLRSVGQNPLSSLETFDALARHCRPAASLLGQLIERYLKTECGCADRRDSDAVDGLIDRFIRQPRSSYGDNRKRLLVFCINELIDPRWVGPPADYHYESMRQSAASVSTLSTDSQSFDSLKQESWDDAIMADGPLRYVYLGYRAYWG